jgi:transposase
MSGEITRMSKIKQLLHLHSQGESNRNIAKTLGLDKETVNVYVRKIKANSFEIKELLLLEDPVLEGKFMAGSAAYTDERFEVFKTLLPHFEQELKRKHVTRRIVWQEYIVGHPKGYGYSQFCFHLNQMQIARNPVAILEHQAGEKLYVDFAGDTLEYIDIETGEIHKVQVFVATLPYSNYSFVMAVPSQSTDDFLCALSCCLSFLGGCPKILVPDNLKAAVIKADKYEPELNRVMEDFANHYGFVVIPTRVRKPRDKAAVENTVKIIYHRVYAKLRNHKFFSIEDINVAFMEKVREHNQTRMQQRAYSREEKFLAQEKHTLSPLPTTSFEMKYYADLRVATNNCIYLGRDKHHYSVPHTYIGQKVSVIYTRSLVQIYCNGQSIAVHQRSYGFGYTVVKEHLCSTHQHYKDRSPEYYIKTAKKYSAVLGELIEKIFEREETPEIVFKRCDGLLYLQRTTEPELFDRACQFALKNNTISYKSLQKIIKNKAYLTTETELQENKKSLPKHENIRGRKYYQQMKFNFH